MRITFHGAAQTVTGSMYQLEVNGSRLLLECGLFQGPRRDTFEKNRGFPFPPNKVDAVLLSHAHIDHSGNLPNLVKQGFSGAIYGTPATTHLADLMLRDSGHVQERQAESTSYHRSLRGEPPVDPLYTEEDAARVKQYLKDAPYNEPFEPIPGVVARYRDAGHILGSAGMELVVDEHHQKHKIWFSGDIGRRKQPIIRDPVLPEEADYLIMESTYGDKPHRSPEEAYAEMREVIQRTLNRGGKVIIPSFAVGRTQELVYNLSKMSENGDLPANIPIYVDSPLAVNASKIFRAHPECFDKEMLAEVNSGHPALEFKQLTYINSLDDSKALNERTDPMIIISASGMAEVGRIVYHIRWNIENRLNTIMIVSWQAPNTMGRRLADREKLIKIFGYTFKVKAEIATIGGLSAHAGQDLLLEYALRVKGKAKQVHIVHGEPKVSNVLISELEKRGMQRVFYPEPHARIEI